jgi:hypothetical protein
VALDKQPIPPIVPTPITILGVTPATAGYKTDGAAYVIPLGRFQRPRFYVIGGLEFEWPGGTEGLMLAGNATLAEHLYIGDNVAELQVVHRANERIEMSGQFPGRTGAANVRLLRAVLRAVDPPDHKRLELPGILTQAQKVIAESWEFTHDNEGRIGSFDYAITFRITGPGGSVDQPQLLSTQAQLIDPITVGRGDPARVFIVRDKRRTIRAIAFEVFGNPNLWRRLYDLNIRLLTDLLGDLPLSQIPTVELPLGTKVEF